MTTEHDDLDFSMFDLPARHGPCKAATAPEMDPVERRLERARESAEHIAAAAGAKALARGALPCNALSIRNQVRQYEMSKRMKAAFLRPLEIGDTEVRERFASSPLTLGVEVKHGSGKVKV